MSRYVEGDDYGYNNAGELWQANVRRALKGKRGLAALYEMREALLALPEKRLIERALCTAAVTVPVELPERMKWSAEVDYEKFHQNNDTLELAELVGEVGKGVCAVGAYIWHKRVKAGEDPQQVFESMPVLPDFDHDMSETAHLGREAGLAGVLAWEFAYKNDEIFGGLSAEARYAAYLGWIEDEILHHPLAALNKQAITADTALKGNQSQ